MGCLLKQFWFSHFASWQVSLMCCLLQVSLNLQKQNKKCWQIRADAAFIFKRLLSLKLTVSFFLFVKLSTCSLFVCFEVYVVYSNLSTCFTINLCYVCSMPSMTVHIAMINILWLALWLIISYLIMAYSCYRNITHCIGVLVTLGSTQGDERITLEQNVSNKHTYRPKL